jgi:hypothetical protein
VQTAKALVVKVEQLQSELRVVQANADTALAKDKPKKQDDTTAKKAEELQIENRRLQSQEQEAKQRTVQLEHALECKDARIRAIQEDVKAAQEEKAAVIKTLQGTDRV